MNPVMDHAKSISDNGRYPEFCKRAAQDPGIFAHFKRNPVYQEILEHVSPELGAAYIEEIEAQWPQLLSMSAMLKFRINDAVGDPIKSEYRLIGNMSPTTLRYVKVASDLRHLFGDLTGISVAEIGGGYGGQFLICDMIWILNFWTIFDLRPVLDLVDKYLKQHETRSDYFLLGIESLQKLNDNGFGLAISNYGFSELPADLQKKYIDAVLIHSQRGYMTMNNAHPDGMTVGELLKLIPGSHVIDEKPMTSAGNYILVWGDE